MGAWVGVVVFVGTTLLVLLVFALFNRDSLLVSSRVRQLGGAGPGRSAAERARDLLARLPLLASAVRGGSAAEAARLRERFAHAGLYTPHGPPVYLAAKALL